MPETERSVESEYRHVVALSLIPGIGPRKTRDLLTAFGSARQVFQSAYSQLVRIPGIGKHLASEIRNFDRYGVVDRQFMVAHSQGARFIHFDSDEYPPNLRQIYDPPPFLWVNGSLSVNWDGCIAVVGTRRPSEYGKDATRNLVAGLCEAGCTIISGLAYGIDAIAHRAAVDHGATTMAVLGSGLDIIYPGSHHKLAADITKNGALISTFPFGTEPEPANFPQRNRIISGLTVATVVIEAFEQGGALLTAANALDQNREVMAVPGSIFSKQSTGTNRLIKDGAAKLVQSVDDILIELGLDTPNSIEQVTNPGPLPENLTGVERKIVTHLNRDPTHIDQICSRWGLPASTITTILLSLELKGCIRQLDGCYFVRV